MKNTNPIPTGLAPLDSALGGGLRPGTLTVIAARPGMGMTALALQIANYIASAARKKAWLYTGGTGERNPADVLGKLLRFRDSCIPIPFILCDGPHWSSAIIERELTGKPVSSVVIDELFSLAPNRPERYGNFSAALPAMAQELKHLARTLNVPVICNARLSRDLEERADPHPDMADFAYALPMGEAVDTVLLLYRSGYYDSLARQARFEPAQITVAQRHGGEKTIFCRWDRRFLRFEEEK